MHNQTENQGIATKRILVVDDEPHNIRLLSQTLRRDGYDVLTAQDGAAALRLVANSSVDMVLLDIMMPGMDGFEVCKRLKADESTSHIAIIFVSALDNPHHKVQALQMGGVDYITKPIQVQEVLARVKTHLTIQDLQRQLEERNALLERALYDHQCAEETLQEYRNHLETLVADRTRELEKEIAERKRAELALQERIRFETLLSDLSAALVNLLPESGGNRIMHALQKIVDFLDVDRITLFEFTQNQAGFELRYTYGRPGTPVMLPLSMQLPWYAKQVRDGDMVLMQTTDDLPQEAKTTRTYYANIDLKSNLTIPLQAAGELLGGMALSTFQRHWHWPADLVPRLKLIGEIFANALLRARTRQALEASKESYQMLTELSRDMISLHDAAGHYIYASPICRTMLGYEPTDLIGRNAYDFFHPEDRVLVAEHHHAILEGAQPPPVSYRVRRQDGVYVWLETTDHVIQHPETGEVEQIVCVSRDVTWRKQMQTQLQAYTQHLEELVEAKVQELEVERAKVLQTAKLAALGEMATGVAHEINQPLTAILFEADYLKTVTQQAGSGETEALAVDLDELYHIGEALTRDIERIRRITDHLRAFGRISKGAVVEVDVNQPLQDSTILIEERLRVHGVNVQWELAPNLPKITANANKLEQVFLNLISNAEYALEEMARRVREGEVQRANYQKQLVLSTMYQANGHAAASSQAAPEGHVIVSIYDNGCGITPEHQARIFEPFFTTKPVGEGTGLGLSISYGLITEMGGDIAFESIENEGTTFTLHFPATGPCLDQA